MHAIFLVLTWMFCLESFQAEAISVFVNSYSALVPTKSSGADVRRSPRLVLDNRGGYSHAGRALLLDPDGTFTEILYDCDLDNQEAHKGTYSLNRQRTHLRLFTNPTTVEDLYRITFLGKWYWVQAEDRERASKFGERWLRRTSLRVRR